MRKINRAHKFINEVREELLTLMGKGLQQSIAKELNLIVALCETHAKVCEFIAIQEKLQGSNINSYESSPMGSKNWALVNIESELSAAEKYYHKWQEAGEASYKTIGKDELRHAEILFKQAEAQEMNANDKSALQCLVNRYKGLLAKLA